MEAEKGADHIDLFSESKIILRIIWSERGFLMGKDMKFIAQKLELLNLAGEIGWKFLKVNKQQEL